MTTKDLIRGHMRRSQTAVNNTLVVGDSLNNAYNSLTTNRNMVSFNVASFATTSTLFVGQAYGFLSSGVTTNGVYGGETQTGGAGIAAPVLVRPGEAWPQTGETKINVRATKAWYCSGDVTAASNYWQALDYPRGPGSLVPINADWSTGATMSYTLSARSSPTSVATWTLQCFNGNGSTSGTAVALDTLQAAAAYKCFQKTSFTTSGTHTASGLLCSIKPGAEAENGTTLRDVCFMSFGLRNTGRTTGTFWGHTGYGSWKPDNHASEDGSLITPDGTDYIGAYSDAALAHDYYCFQWNHVLIWIGANPDNSGDMLSSAQRYRTQVLKIMARHRAAANANGLASPTFTLISQYFASTVTAYYEMCRDALYDIALHDTSCELIDIYGHILDTYGTYGAWQTAGLGDTVHLKDAGAAIVSDRMELIGFGTNTTLTPPTNTGLGFMAAGGPASSNKLTMIGKGRIYRSAS